MSYFLILCSYPKKSQRRHPIRRFDSRPRILGHRGSFVHVRERSRHIRPRSQPGGTRSARFFQWPIPRCGLCALLRGYLLLCPKYHVRHSKWSGGTADARTYCQNSKAPGGASPQSQKPCRSVKCSFRMTALERRNACRLAPAQLRGFLARLAKTPCISALREQKCGWRAHRIRDLVRSG
jgi:hypothetical protein